MKEQQFEQCGRCGRDLKSEKSKKAGMGPVCLRKDLAEKAALEEKEKADGRENTANDRRTD